MNIELLKFMDSRVRIKRDISHQEYRVAGIVWSTDCILVMLNSGITPIYHTLLELVPEETDEDVGWYKA